MNQRIYNRCLEVAKALKPKIQSGKSFHGSFAIRKSKIVCIGTNNYKKAHNVNRFGHYENWKGFETPYTPCQHSEAVMLVRLGEEDLSDYEILNVRIDNNGKPNMSKPCVNCARVLGGFSPRRVFYSDNEGNLQQDDRF